MNKNSRGVLLGALCGALAGTVSLLFMPQGKKILKKVQDQTEEWTEKAKELASSTVEEVRVWRKPRKSPESRLFLWGSLLGGMLGAVSAVLTTPKAGKDVRKILYKTYHDATHLKDKIQANGNIMAKHRLPHPIRKAALPVERKKKNPTKLGQ